MGTTVLEHTKGDFVEHIDVHDLPEDQAQFVAAFVEFLRGGRRREQDSMEQDRDWYSAAVTSFAKDWDNDQDAIYDNWREHYHV